MRVYVAVPSEGESVVIASLVWPLAVSQRAVSASPRLLFPIATEVPVTGIPFDPESPNVALTVSAVVSPANDSAKDTAFPVTVKVFAFTTAVAVNDPLLDSATLE